MPTIYESNIENSVFQPEDINHCTMEIEDMYKKLNGKQVTVTYLETDETITGALRDDETGVLYFTFYENKL